MDEQLLRNRSVLRDFTVTTLSAIPNLYGRLTYIASLRDLSSGSYEHSGLAAVYPKEAVQEALECCHSEIFRKILETPLSVQEDDLRECLEAMSDEQAAGGNGFALEAAGGLSHFAAGECAGLS